jgi:periplasmic divalent cation tolerance protein
MTTSDHVLVLTTLPADADAAAVATALIEERLAGCVNILPQMESVYRWKGGIERDRERQVIMKTTAGRVEALRGRLAQLHPYELPEFLVLAIAAGSNAYLAWLSEATKA